MNVEESEIKSEKEDIEESKDVIQEKEYEEEKQSIRFHAGGKLNISDFNIILSLLSG